VKPGPVGQGTSRGLFRTGVGLGGFDCGAYCWTGAHWARLVLSEDPEVVDWGVSPSDSPYLLIWPADPREASQEHFFVRRFGILGGVTLITCKVLFMNAPTCLVTHVSARKAKGTVSPFNLCCLGIKNPQC